MERLTVKLNDGTWALKRNADESSISMAIARLAAYKGTGLEPAQIEQLKGEVFGLTVDKKELNEYQNVGSIDHLIELAQAEKDGRLVVLPAKPNETVYQWKKGDDIPSMFRLDGVSINWDGEITYQTYWGKAFTPEDFGKTVFLTREEAEAALKKREADNEHEH